jgi:hypothetical protein
MSTLVIRKKSLKTWEHYLDDRPLFISSKFFFNTPEGFKFQIVEEGKATLGAIAIEDITLYDDSTGGGAETFATVTELSIRLEALDYTGHYRNGDISVGSLISTDVGNDLVLGTDGLLYVVAGSGGGTVWTIVTADITAQYDKYYSIGNNTGIEVTSPTPTVARGYVVYSVNGDFLIDGFNFTSNSLVYVFYNGSTWTYNIIGSGGGSFDPAVDLVGTITPTNAPIDTGQTIEEGFSNAQGQIEGIYTDISFIDFPTVLGVNNTAVDVDAILESTGSGTVMTLNPNTTTILNTSGIQLSLAPLFVEIRDTLGLEVSGLSKEELSFRNVSGGITTIRPQTSVNNVVFQHPDKPVGTEIYRMLSDAQSEQLRINGIDYFNDFIGISPTDTGQSVNDTILAFNQSGTGAFNRPLRNTETFSAVSNSNSGVLQQSMGTTSTGSANVSIGVGGGSVVGGAGVITSDALVCMSALSDGTNRYTYKKGLFSLFNANPVAAIAFVYDEGGVEGIVNSTASPNWRVVTIDASTRTITNTGVDVSATAFQKLYFIVNAGGTSVEFYIDDVLVATHTTNIPTGWTKKLMYASGALKYLGTTERIAYLDYVKINQKLTTPRT